MTEYQAFKVYQEANKVVGRLESLTQPKIGQGQVLIRTAYSSVNYKDALAATGKGKIIRQFPLIAGIDVSGIVAESKDPRFKEGDAVLVTGYDFGVAHDGGYTEYAIAPADWAISLPDSMSLYQAMALGTAGFTVALCVQRLEENGQKPDLGPFIITGATGGVGSFGVDIMSSLGYEVVAVTGKAESHQLLTDLGANKVLDRNQINLDGPPLEKGQWGGAIDNIGGDMLAWLTRTTRPWGNIASVGLAGGTHLNTTVMPFILRGVSLLGITSSGCPGHYRKQLWNRLATDLTPNNLDKIITNKIGLEELPEIFNSMLAGNTIGRTVVEVNPPE